MVLDAEKERKLMLVTIIIPNYNCEKFIEAAIMSIIQQECSVEIIVVDDGSTDSSIVVIENLCRKYNSIHLYKFVNQGLAKSRNFGITVARGDLIIFLDSDDVFELGMIHKILAYNTSSKFEMLGFNARQIDEIGNEISSIPYFNKKYEYHQITGREYLTKTKDINFTAPAPLWCYEANFLKYQCPVFEDILHEDEHFTFVSILNASKLSFIPEIGYNYRVRAGSLTNSTNSAKRVIGICKASLYIYRDTKNMNIEKSRIASNRIRYLIKFSISVLLQDRVKNLKSIFFVILLMLYSAKFSIRVYFKEFRFKIKRIKKEIKN